MLFLQNHHIIDVYCAIDDILPPVQKPKGGRPPLLTESELATILIWNTLTVRQKTIKYIYKWILLYHRKDFPKIPHYSAFVYECQKITPHLCFLLDRLLLKETPLRLVDSTMIEVCKLSRADSHKVAKGIASFGKNWQGWHFGFKLHASIDMQGRFSGVTITPANEHDAQMMPKILHQHTKIAVGDTS